MTEAQGDPQPTADSKPTVESEPKPEVEHAAADNDES